MALGKILVVDDQEDLVEIAKRLLEKEGYEIVTAYTGKTGIEKAKNDKPDLIILDILLPDMDGISVCENIKNDPATKDIKIIMLTSRDTGDVLEECLAKKADWFIAKPYDEKYLVSKIRKILNPGDEKGRGGHGRERQ